MLSSLWAAEESLVIETYELLSNSFNSAGKKNAVLKWNPNCSCHTPH